MDRTYNKKNYLYNMLFGSIKMFSYLHYIKCLKTAVVYFERKLGSDSLLNFFMFFY